MRPIVPLFTVAMLAGVVIQAESAEEEIRSRTGQFTEAMVAGNLDIVDEIFEPDSDHFYYDINETAQGFDRLKRIWNATITNYSLTRFKFGKDMRIVADGERAVQMGSWLQTQVSKEGQSRDIEGRATILWRKSEGQWRVWHYHASMTPPRPARRNR